MKKITGFMIALMLIVSVGQSAIIGVTQANINHITVTSDNTYILVEGVTVSGQFVLTNVSNVIIKSQTKGILKGFITLNGTCHNIRIENLDIFGYNICIHDRSSGRGLTIENCSLHDCTYGIWQRIDPPAQMKSNLYVGNTKIFNCKNDGWYSYRVDNITADTDSIWNVNTLWVAPETSQKIASGDGLQWILISNVRITYCYINRSQTGNKFNAIFSGTNVVSPNDWIISNNTFIMPLKTGQGGAGLYFYDLKPGTNIEYSFNTMTGLMCAIYFASPGTFYSTGSTYTNASFGIQLINTSAKGYSVDDTFVNIPRNKWGTSNVKITHND